MQHMKERGHLNNNGAVTYLSGKIRELEEFNKSQISNTKIYDKASEQLLDQAKVTIANQQVLINKQTECI